MAFTVFTLAVFMPFRRECDAIESDLDAIGRARNEFNSNISRTKTHNVLEYAMKERVNGSVFYVCGSRSLVFTPQPMYTVFHTLLLSNPTESKNGPLICTAEFYRFAELKNNIDRTISPISLVIEWRKKQQDACVLFGRAFVWCNSNGF